MKNIKAFLCLTLALCALGSFVSCKNGGDGGESTAAPTENPAQTSPRETLSAEEICDKMKNGVEFGIAIEYVEPEAVEFMYQELPEGTKCIAYAAGGASAEELAVFTVQSDADAQSVKSLLAERVKERTQAFATYKPDDVPKLENAVIESNGGTVIFCVSGSWKEASALAKGLLG